MTDTYWNGEPAAAERGTGVMLDSPEFPRFWGREEGLVGQRVPVVKVNYGKQEFYLYNDNGLGWRKVTTGKGLPMYGHQNLDVEDFEPLQNGGD